MAVKLVGSVEQKISLPVVGRGQIEEAASTLSGKSAGFIFNKMFPKSVCAYEERPSREGYCMRCSLVTENGVMAEGIALGATQGKAREAARFEAINTLFMALRGVSEARSREQLSARIREASHSHSNHYPNQVYPAQFLCYSKRETYEKLSQFNKTRYPNPTPFFQLYITGVIAMSSLVSNDYQGLSSHLQNKTVPSLVKEIEGSRGLDTRQILHFMFPNAYFETYDYSLKRYTVLITLNGTHISYGKGESRQKAEAHALFNLLDTMKEFGVGTSNS